MKCKESSLWDKTYKCGELEVSAHIEGLYNWEEAMALQLPEGWRVATDTDWDKIEHHFKDDAFAIIKGLEVVLDGFRHTNGMFISHGADSFLWSPGEPSGGTEWIRCLDSRYASVFRYPNSKALGCSVRCVKDIEREAE